MTNSGVAISLHEAIKFNNDGIQDAMNGQDAQAISKLSNSLRLFKQLLAVDSQGEDDVLTQPSELIRTLHSTTHELPQLRDSVFFLFNSVVSLAETISFDAEDSHIYCSVIILNLAVLHHRKALDGATLAQRADGLKRAERFYSMVTTILSNDGSTVFSQPTGILAQMAALNNLAYIRAEMGDLKGSSDCFRMLAWLVNRARSDYTDIINERDLEGMMLNVLMSKRQSVAPAA
jgi:hypothetical protein